MKRYVLLFFSFMSLCAWAQTKELPSLHVEGRWLVDKHGNQVVLHGVMDTPNMYFNGWRWGSPWTDGTNYNDAGVAKCLPYFEKLFGAMEQTNCDVFRLHMDPAWTNDDNITATGFTKNAEGKTIDPNGQIVDGEANISHFSKARYEKWLPKVYLKLAEMAMNHGMYVVVRPPGVCPGALKVGDYYNKYLLYVWDIFSQQEFVKKHAGQISIELANEPVSVKNAQNQDDPKALHDFFQPVVDKIRSNGFTGIIWLPGTGWQANYTSYAQYPITGDNIGYAVHDYPGWYGCADKNLTASDVPKATKRKIVQFHSQVPVVDTNPIIVTEIDWSPPKPGTGHYNEHGEWVESNYGTWETGRTSVWGNITKGVYEYFGNISMTLSGTGCLIDIDKLLATNQVYPAFDGLEEACGKACMDWYAEYIKVNYAHPDDEEETGDAYTIVALSSESDTYDFYIGANRRLSLNAVYADGHKKEVSEYVTYTVSNPSVADVKNGYLEAVSVGETQVTVSYIDSKGTAWQTIITVKVSKAPEYEIEGYTRLTDLSEITAQPFAIMNKESIKMFYGSNNQNLGFDDPQKVISNTGINGYLFKAEPLAGNAGCYLLRLITLSGSEYNIWGRPGYLNSQPATGNCCFILGLNNQNGEDLKDGAVWEIKYDADRGFSLKNMGTGKYLKTSDAAKYDSPVYMSFYKKGSSSGISNLGMNKATDDAVYSLHGVKVGTADQMDALPRGIYIIGGKKVVKSF